MAANQGLWISIHSNSALIIEDVINENDRFTSVVPASDIRPKIAELCLVSLKEQIVHYLGISQAGQRVATGLKRIAISRCVALDGIRISELKSHLNSRFKSKLDGFSTSARRISP